jgi:hypothetical protein
MTTDCKTHLLSNVHLGMNVVHLVGKWHTDCEKWGKITEFYYSTEASRLYFSETLDYCKQSQCCTLRSHHSAIMTVHHRPVYVMRLLLQCDQGRKPEAQPTPQDSAQDIEIFLYL